LLRNIQIVAERARERSLAQEIAAYYDDRRNQSYSVIDGLGPLTQAYLAGSGGPPRSRPSTRPRRACSMSTRAREPA
jgi:hypothetical protein